MLREARLAMERVPSNRSGHCSLLVCDRRFSPVADDGDYNGFGWARKRVRPPSSLRGSRGGNCGFPQTSGAEGAFWLTIRVEVQEKNDN